ncbi:MAG: L-rhamnose mutarotase [Duncaniella sp.]|nr:L-rhamnose mutarotase [Duncaniella sp.]
MNPNDPGYLIEPQPTARRRYCRTLDLRDDEALIAEYRLRHSAGRIWREILEGIREVGILEMEIYLRGTRLFMILETPADLDLEAAMERLATLPRQQEWEDYMSVFQLTVPGASSAEKWQPMERVFHLYKPSELAE